MAVHILGLAEICYTDDGFPLNPLISHEMVIGYESAAAISSSIMRLLSRLAIAIISQSTKNAVALPKVQKSI